MGPILASRSILAITALAGAAISSKQLVGFDGTPTGVGGQVLGIAQTDAAIGEDFTVDVLGTFDLVAPAAIALGTLVASDANGAPVTTADPAIAFGRALTATTNPGDIVKILVK